MIGHLEWRLQDQRRSCGGYIKQTQTYDRTAPRGFSYPPWLWNVPLWGEIGVYVAAVITIALCAWGVCKNIEVWRRRKDEKLPSDPSRRDRLLKEAVLEEKVRQTSAGRMHAVLVVGFFLLFLGTATATLDWDVGHYVFGKQFLRGTSISLTS